MSQRDGFVCACADPLRFYGDTCEQVRQVGACASSPCGMGLCIGSQESMGEFECVCDSGYVANGAGVCQLAGSGGAPTLPVCSDGIQGGEETDIDCGTTECGGCEAGLVCTSDASCASDLVCAEETLTCAAASRPAGVYVTLTGIKVNGVSKAQFLAVMLEPFTESLRSVTGAEAVTITGVRTMADPASQGRRLRRVTGRRLDDSNSGAVGIEVDAEIRFAAGTSAEEAQARAIGYVQGSPAAGGNGLQDDLVAAVPALGSRVEVDSGAVQLEGEELEEESATASVGRPGGEDDDEGVDGDGGGGGGSNGGAVAGAVIGSLVAVGLVAGGAYYMLVYRKKSSAGKWDKIADQRSGSSRAAAAGVQGMYAGMYGGGGAGNIMASNPLRVAEEQGAKKLQQASRTGQRGAVSGARGAAAAGGRHFATYAAASAGAI